MGGSNVMVPTPLARRLAHLAYGALSLACRGQPASQMRVSAWLPLMIAHVPLRVGAASTVVSLLTGNRPLLEQRVSGDLLRLVHSQLRRHGFRSELLAVLRLMCVCDGSPLDTHQVSSSFFPSTWLPSFHLASFHPSFHLASLLPFPPYLFLLTCSAPTR